MGQTVGKSAQYQAAIQLFNSSEKEQMLMLHRELCSRSGQSDRFNEDSLKALSGAYLSHNCIHNLFMYMLSLKPNKSDTSSRGSFISEEEFVIAISHALKGNIEEQSQLFICLTSGSNTTCSFEQLQQTLHDFHESLLLITESTPSFNTWNITLPQLGQASDKLLQAWLHPLLAKNKKQVQSEVVMPAKDQLYSVEDLEAWLQKSSMLLMTIKATMHGVFPISSTSSLGTTITASLAPPFPRISAKSTKSASTLLDVPSTLYLNYHLPQDFRDEWCLLFDSKLHGESFSTMCSKIVDRGVLLFVVRDKDNQVFGGFTAKPITANPKFKGSADCFLYQTQPCLEAYHTSGLNENFFYYNVHQQTMPNGIGFGGQLNYFGLWLSEDYGHGHSKAEPKCTTYSSPQLSKHVEFAVDAIEVWRVGPEKKPLNEELGQPAPGSILDKDPAAKAMLSLIDKGPVSEGLRESDATASNPEQQTLEQGPYS